MKKLVLFLSFMFVGVAGHISTANAEVAFANEDCAKIADWVVKDIPDGYKNKD